MTLAVKNGIHDDLIGTLGIRSDDGEIPSQSDIETLLEEEVDRYVVYRYVELLFVSKGIDVTIVSWEYQRASLRYGEHEIDLILITDPDTYERGSKQLEDEGYTGKDTMIIHTSQAIIDSMRSELAKILNSKNLGMKLIEQFIRESFRTIPLQKIHNYKIDFSAPQSTGSLARQLLEMWIKVDDQLRETREKSKKPHRKK